MASCYLGLLNPLFESDPGPAGCLLAGLWLIELGTPALPCPILIGAKASLSLPLTLRHSHRCAIHHVHRLQTLHLTQDNMMPISFLCRCHVLVALFPS